MEYKDIQLLGLLKEKERYTKEILEIGNKMTELMKMMNTEETFKLLEARIKVAEKIKSIDDNIAELLHNDEDAKRSSKLKKIINMNEPDNLKPKEHELVSVMRRLAKIMKELAKSNKRLKTELEKEQKKILDEIELLRVQKKKILHSKKFLDANNNSEENKLSWDIKL